MSSVHLSCALWGEVDVLVSLVGSPGFLFSGLIWFGLVFIRHTQICVSSVMLGSKVGEAQGGPLPSPLLVPLALLDWCCPHLEICCGYLALRCRPWGEPEGPGLGSRSSPAPHFR